MSDLLDSVVQGRSWASISLDTVYLLVDGRSGEWGVGQEVRQDQAQAGS